MTLPGADSKMTRDDGRLVTSAETQELADFDATGAQLQAQIEGFAKLRRQVRFFPLFAVVTAPLGLFYAKWAAGAIVITWLSFWSATLYITWMRTWQYKGELKRIRSEAARLRAALRATTE